MASFFNYKIQEFIIESLDGSKSIDATSCVASIKYFEDLFSPSIFITMVLANTDGLLTSLPIRGGERVRLKLYQEATNLYLSFEELKNPLYIYKVYGSTSESTREVFAIDLAPAEVFSNETTRVFNRYPESGEGQLISDSVEKILNDVLKTNKVRQIERSANSYSFYGNSKKPFGVLTWLCPKAIPTIGKSSTTEGTAGFLFYENRDGYHFRSVDTLMGGLVPSSSDQSDFITYYYDETATNYASRSTNTKILTIPTFERNENVFENMRIGMYSSLNIFFDLNTKQYNEYQYKLSDSYDTMKHVSSRSEKPKIPMDLENSPTRLMVGFIDTIVSSPLGTKVDAKFDERVKYQSQSVARYNLAFRQFLNITIPLNFNLKVGDVIRIDIGKISKTSKEKDQEKSGLYLIKELAHDFSDIKGYTGLKLIRDSYGAR